MRKIISFMHISLDGFVAGPNGEMNWINVDDELFDHVSQRISQTDTALYGRVTFGMMEGYWHTAADHPGASKHDIEHAAWYKTANKVVLSTTLNAADFSNTTVISNNIAANVHELKKAGEGEILLFGSPTATHALIAEGLIDGYWLFVNPVVIGEGIPLFKNGIDKIKLKLQPTGKQFTNGVTELRYEVER